MPVSEVSSTCSSIWLQKNERLRSTKAEHALMTMPETDTQDQKKAEDKTKLNIRD